MKNNLAKLLFTCLISLSLLTTAGIAEAYNCKWVGGHYNRHGHYVPKHKVCYHGYHHCRWVSHYNKYGHYVKKYRVCR